MRDVIDLIRSLSVSFLDSRNRKQTSEQGPGAQVGWRGLDQEVSGGSGGRSHVGVREGA